MRLLKGIGLHACRVGGAAVVLASGMLSIDPVDVRASKGEWLITPDEAAMAPAPEVPGGAPLDIGRQESNLGPTIEVVKPNDGGRVPAPIEIDIKFVPKTLPVDLASLRVTVVKFISFDITDRVRDFATVQGIHVKEAKIPAGKHTVRVSVADIEGARSIKEVDFEVQ